MHLYPLRLLSLAVMVLLLIACGHDSTTPTVSGSGIIVTAMTNTSLTLAWNKATDNRDDPTALRYKVYMSAANPAYGSFDSLDEVEAGTLVTTLTDADSVTISAGIAAGNAYYFNVVVLDTRNNKTVYQSLGEFFHAGQLSYYPFNGHSNDVMATANHLVAAAGLTLPTLTSDRFGRAGHAYTFDPALAQCLQSTANVGITGNASRSLSFWVRSSNTPAGVTRVPLAWGNGTANGSTFGFQETGVGNNWIAWLWGTASVSTATAVTAEWEHWVVAYDSATDRVYTYKNGSVVNNGSTPAVVANTVDSLLHVGCGLEAGVLSYLYSGRVDDIRIFNQLLGAADVANLHAVTRP